MELEDSYCEDNLLSDRMDIIINKCRPYLSSPEDEPKLIARLKDLGVESIDDLKFLNFENDLHGIFKVVRCCQLKLELSKGMSESY